MKDAPGKYRTMRARDVQQNVDASALFEEVHNSWCKDRMDNGYMMLMEDDFEMCPFALHHLNRAIHAAENLYFPNFSALRVSFGFNGMVVHCKDVGEISNFLFRNRFQGPPDAMTSPWWTKYDEEGAKYFGPDRNNCAYRHNLLDHIGDFSSVWERGSDQRGRFPRCYDDLYFNGMSHNDWFDYRLCRGKEFSPCDNKPTMTNSMLTMMRASPEFDREFQMPTNTKTIKVVKGKPDQDCNDVCKGVKMSCARFALTHINRCRVLRKHFDCRDCISHQFTQPTHYRRSPMQTQDDETCYESHIPDQMVCEGKDANVVRLCTCHDADQEDNINVNLSLNDFIAMFHNKVSKVVGLDYLPLLNKAMIKHEINNCRRQAAFIAQIGHETGDLGAFESIASGHELEMDIAYGNDEKGDGVKYKGRGPLQMKGKRNYKRVGELVGLDLLSKPELAADKKYTFDIAAQLWSYLGCNQLADQTGTDVAAFDKITKKINHGEHGKPDRDFRFLHNRRIMDCE
ncbi:hypothetical protein AKO1_014796 [Acrasis kona]|uniref:Glycoside hydrolase family 19 catalytic domain-containing protein n=1 Tax=Acrasis kona TaxID=1008807 RepID=A0AAW2Z118_9EUKA